MAQNRSAAETIAETYYDSDDADNFYEKVWGGEDIHIGIYDDPKISIHDASHKTVALMASQLRGVGNNTRVIDLGAGYGGSARYLAKTFGCKVTCPRTTPAWISSGHRMLSCTAASAARCSRKSAAS